MKLDSFTSLIKSTGYRWSRFVYPKRCPTCAHGPVHQAVYYRMHQKLAEAEKMPAADREAFDTKYAHYATLFNLFRLHKEQRRTCRKATQLLDRNLKAGEGWLVRDFVNHFDGEGEHVKCLHWVLRWRDNDGYPIQMLKLRNYCSDKDTMRTGIAFTRDVDEFHLTRLADLPTNLQENFTGLTDHLRTITITSDHGSHFSSPKYYLHMCTYYRIYPGKEFELLFYEAYHGEGRCDGAGAQDKVQALANVRKGIVMHGAESFTRMTNENNDARSFGYEFKQINYSENILPHDKELQTYKLRGLWCQIKFEYEGRCQETEGVVLYRFVPNEGL
jgi:hypothetical protein